MADYEKAGRDSATAVIAKGGDAAAVAKEVCGLISRASHASQDPRPAVVAAVKGAMGAVVLAGQDFPEAAVRTLAGLADISLISRVGPEEVMSWVMEGIAAVVHMAGPDARSKVVSRIEERFLGAGEVFSAMCDKPR